MRTLKKLTATLLLGVSSMFVTTVAHALPFGTSLSQNTTGFSDSLFLGAPDGVGDATKGTKWVGIGGQTITYDFGLDRVTNGSGIDFVIYEVAHGSPEFGLITVSASTDGVNYSSALTALTGVDILGDGSRGDSMFSRGYDLGALLEARFIRIDGTGTGVAGSSNGFDLDAIGLVNYQDNSEITNPVPEPASLALLGLGLAGLGAMRRRQKTT